MIEAGNMLIVTIPSATCDVEFLKALQEYVLGSLRTRCLVIPRGAELEIRALPQLGAVEVNPDAEPKPAKRAGRKQRAAAKAEPESGTGAAPTPTSATAASAQPPVSPTTPTPPTMLREKAVVKKAAPRRAVRSRLPYEDEIVSAYRQAANREAQIRILADLNVCTEERIRDILREAGEVLPEKKAGGHG